MATTTSQPNTGSQDYHLIPDQLFLGSQNACEFGGDTTPVDAGVVFPSVAIPSGSVVTNAYVTLQQGTAYSDNPTADIYLEDADNPSPPTSTSDYDSRVRTTNNVAFSPSDVGTGTTQDTPDISAVIQEVIDRAGWASGNNLHVIFDSTAPLDDGLNHQFEFTSYEGDSANAAILTVEYQSPTTLPALSPTGDGTTSGFENEAAATTNLYQSVDDAPSSADGDTTYIVNSSGAAASAFFDVTDMPSDFDEIASLSVDIRLRKE